MRPPSLRQLAASFVALIAWVGLGTQLRASIELTGGSLAAAIWSMTFYFTVLTNILVAVAFTLLAIRVVVPSVLLAGVVMSILLVGVVYHLLLRGLIELSGGALLADFLLHTVTPILVPVWWLLFAEKGALRWRDPFLWAVYPLAYFIYGVARAPAMGRYPYPFMDVTKLGWLQVGINSAVVAAGFCLAGFAAIWIDRTLRNSRLT